MAKKSKAERVYAKQLQRVEKLQKKAKQKGVTITLPEVKNTTKVTSKEVTSIKKSIQKAKKKVEEGTKNKKITEKSLREAIQKRRSQIAEKTAPPEPRRLKPTTPAERLKEEAKRGIKIVDYEKEEAETKEQRKAQAAQERIELMPGDLVKVPEKVNRDPDFFSSAVIKQFSDMIKQFPRHAEPLLQGWLDQLIKSQGKEAVATMLQKGAAEGHVVNREIAYSMDKIQSYISDMLNYLPEMTDWYKAEIMEQFETFDAF